MEEYKIFKFVSDEIYGGMIDCHVIMAKDVDEARGINGWDKQAFDVSEMSDEDFFNLQDEQLKSMGYDKKKILRKLGSHEDRKENLIKIGRILLTTQVVVDCLG